MPYFFQAFTPSDTVAMLTFWFCPRPQTAHKNCKLSHRSGALSAWLGFYSNETRIGIIRVGDMA